MTGSVYLFFVSPTLVSHETVVHIPDVAPDGWTLDLATRTRYFSRHCDDGRGVVPVPLGSFQKLTGNFLMTFAFRS
jgi:hypothetical protein